MQPRTLAIAAFVLLAGSVALRYLVVHFGLLPVSEEAMLKKAVAITVTYFDQDQNKSLSISDPEQLAGLLAALRMQDSELYYYSGVTGGGGLWWPTPATVTFEFSNGLSRGHTFNGPYNLGGYTVDEVFFNKLRTLVSNHEGHDVDILAHPVVISPPEIPDLNPDSKK
jgi:hypothetical protein